MNINDRKFLIAFSSSFNLGPVTLSEIMKQGPKKVWDRGLNSSDPKFNKYTKYIDETRISVDPEKYLKQIEKHGFKVIILGDKCYPNLLKQINDPPVVLYYKGCLSTDDSISIVGSRKCSHYAIQVINKIVPDLVKCGLKTISGMALGVDSLVHRVTLENKGKTIAILGSGLDQIYPVTNIHLFNQIAENGAVVSEFGLGTPPLKYNFPQRNRIIAGLSQGTLVVEANIKSGSLITASCALDYNRQVYSVPGDISRTGSEGTNNLIKIGAKPVTIADDILIDYGYISNNSKTYLPRNENEKKIYDLLSDMPLYIDNICELAKLDIVEASQNLTLMELNGAIENLGNSTYIRK
ncbi:MAG: DNA-processing protein DprA [Patescibacteria group bacterium]|jgi:DNA processing protein